MYHLHNQVTLVVVFGFLHSNAKLTIQNGQTPTAKFIQSWFITAQMQHWFFIKENLTTLYPLCCEYFLLQVVMRFSLLFIMLKKQI